MNLEKVNFGKHGFSCTPQIVPKKQKVHLILLCGSVCRCLKCCQFQRQFLQFGLFVCIRFETLEIGELLVDVRFLGENN